ncbi:hypothetical protein EDB84DRAFT_1564128 [Lactarius hengduanensis]|nr:hypothetical protein EDB84DRAFT_1564128 [Lactarius hengduanensis]
MAYHYELAHVRSLDPASQATQLAALDAIAMALCDPTIFDFDPVLRLDSVLAAQPHAEAKGQGRAACSTSSPSCPASQAIQAAGHIRRHRRRLMRPDYLDFDSLFAFLRIFLSVGLDDLHPEYAQTPPGNPVRVRDPS